MIYKPTYIWGAPSCTRKKGKINQDLMAYVQQWRPRHSRDCVLRATARAKASEHVRVKKWSWPTEASKTVVKRDSSTKTCDNFAHFFSLYFKSIFADRPKGLWLSRVEIPSCKPHAQIFMVDKKTMTMSGHSLVSSNTASSKIPQQKFEGILQRTKPPFCLWMFKACLRIPNGKSHYIISPCFGQTPWKSPFKILWNQIEPL